MDKMIALGKVLRKRPTDAELLLWKQLRLKQLEGLKFRRQQPIDNYIVDFVCFERRIVIEVDGGQHAIQKEDDILRDTYLTQQGFQVLRFWNNEVLQNINGVLEVIKERCLSLVPARRGRGSLSGEIICHLYSKKNQMNPAIPKRNAVSLPFTAMKTRPE